MRPGNVALQVFINMNTNSKPLQLYDIKANSRHWIPS